MRAFLVVLLPLVATGCAHSGQLTSVTGAAGGTGKVCAPADQNGTAYFAHETITNDSDQDVVVDDIRLVGGQLEVVEWFLADRHWEEGVGSGPLPDSDGYRLGNTLPANGQARVAVTAQSDHPPSQHATVEVRYSDGDHTGVAVLNWQLLVGAPDEQCGN